MRYLTRAWHAGELSDAEADAMLAAYHAHRATVLPQLPAQARWLAETVDVEDARLQYVTVDRAHDALVLLLRAGDQPRGYFDLTLTYRGVRWPALDVPVLRVVAETPDAEALQLEEDVVAPGHYVHRWLWWPFRRELDVEFTDLQVAREPRPDRDFAVDARRFDERTMGAR